MEENLSAEQERAVQTAMRLLNNPHVQVIYIGGAAGTGKTTILKRLRALIRGRVVFAAYTGKAAAVMRRKGLEGATTIHKLLYRARQKSTARLVDLEARLEAAKLVLAADQGNRDAQRHVIDLQGMVKGEKRSVGRPAFDLSVDEESDIAQADVVIVDEASMVGVEMAEHLIKVCRKLIVTGDPYQLPPVAEEGYFTDRKPDILLEQVHRQAADSPILRLATDIRHGRPVHIGDYGPGCRVIGIGDERVEELCMAADQMIVGRNRTRRLANAKHRRLRKIRSKLPIVGDRIVSLRNNHNIGLLNGTLWRAIAVDEPTDSGTRMGMTLTSIDDPGQSDLMLEAWTNIFQGEDKPAYARTDDPECLDFGYAITCHRSQGSEWPSVYVYDESDEPVFRGNELNWLYTAVTRAQEDLTLAVRR